jgi:hypothetical protein
MESQQLTSVGCDSSEQAVEAEAPETSGKQADLAEVVRQIQDDCRIDPNAYLEEVEVSAAGE